MAIKQRIKGFLAWWSEGLLMTLPERWAAGLRHVSDIVTVETQDHLLVFKLYDGAERRLCEERVINPDNKSEQAGINQWLTQHENGIKLILLIPRDMQLNKHLTYPLTSEKNLRAVLGYEMDRQTPFGDDQVYFDYTVTRKDRNSGKIHVNIHLILKKTLRKLLDALSFLDLKPTAATTGIDGQMAGINFIPASERQANDSSDQRFKLMALLSLILLVVALYIPLMRYGTVAEQLDMQIGQNRTQAMQVQALIDKKQSILRRANFLTNQNQYHIPFIQLLQELTRCLADDTWISHLVINKGEIQIRGESETAATVIRLIEQSDYFEKAEFRSPVIKSRSGIKEQFHIAARLSMK